MSKMGAFQQKSRHCLPSETVGVTVTVTEKTVVPLGMRGVSAFLSHCLAKILSIRCFHADRENADRDIYCDSETDETVTLQQAENCDFHCHTHCLISEITVSPVIGRAV